MKADLHTHTTASDGSLSPSELISAAEQAGISVLAITDHDTLEGVMELGAVDDKPMRVLPGVEISSGSGVEVHVLGYGVIPSQALLKRLAAMRAEREERMRRMVKRLNALGVSVTIEQVAGYATGPLGRAHLAQALKERGDVRSVKEAFERYLSPGKAAFVAREKLPVSGVIDIIRENGGVPVLAHPGLMPMDEGRLIDLIGEWRDHGLMGIEAHHPGHSPATCLRFERIARGRGMLVTGGSDFHGRLKPGIRLGDGMAAWNRMQEDIVNLSAALEHARRAVK